MLAIQSTAQTNLKSRSKVLNNAALAVLTAAFLYALMSHPAFATAATGGTGAVTAATTRVTTVATGFYTILQGIGIVILSAAFLYVGYGLAFNGKKWSDVANVAYGATIAGLGSTLVGWLFS